MADLGKILIADDEEIFLNSTADLLRKEGFECDCARDAASAATLLRSGDHDLLIADIKMPGNVELEFIKDVPQIAQDLPVILVTGYPTLDTAIQSLELQVVAYMVKPFDFDQLLTHVHTSVKSFRVHRAIHGIQHRLNDWRKELNHIHDSISTQSRSDASTPVDAFLNLTFGNIIDMLSDLRHLTGKLALNEVQQQVCHLFNCPKLITLTEALQNTITTIEKTKSAFKSKELGELRKNLEELLQQIREPGIPRS